MLNAGIINVSNPCIVIMMSGALSYVISFIIHQAHYEKKKWKRNDFVSFKRQIFISSINNY